MYAAQNKRQPEGGAENSNYVSIRRGEAGVRSACDECRVNKKTARFCRAVFLVCEIFDRLLAVAEAP
jgi:hypothetical protein